MPALQTDLAEPEIARSAAEICDWIVSELARALNTAPASIDPKAPLYALGADSLAALQMTGALAEWLNRDLPATLMWDFGSIAAIAEALADEDAQGIAPSHPGLVELQSKGDRVPLFCFPGAGGHSVTFAPLAAQVGAPHPCFGLTVPGLNSEQEPLEQVEEIAAAMCKTIRAVQPKGPYQLAGYSFGGMLAFESAQQLTAAGETVSLLAIYDTFAPQHLLLRPLWQRAALHAYLLASRPGRVEYLRSQLKKRERERAALNAADAGDQGADTSGPQKFSGIIEQANNRAAHRYRPKPYAHAALLFRAGNRETSSVFYKFDKLLNGWGPLITGGIRAFDLPGDHMNILDAANAPLAAQLLRPHLSDARR